MATYGDKAEYVGSGSKDYVYPGQSRMGGKLVIRANSPAEANNIYNFITGGRNDAILSDYGYGGVGQTPFGSPPQSAQEPEYYYEGGGGYGGGGGGGAPPPRKLADSPEWHAYLNALGLEEGQFRADIDRQRAMAKADAAFRMQGLEPGYAQQRRGIAGSQESRGMARSGEHLRRQAESRASQGRDQAGINFGLGQALGQLESNLANKLMDLGARRAQQELSLRASGYV